MTKDVNILLFNFLRAFITSNMVIDSFRAKVTDFTRKRKLPFSTCTVKIPIIGTFQYINQSKIIKLISYACLIFSHDRAGLCFKISSR